jgi:FlaA1/EpsC-like NDP-sugar epimerase
MNNQSLNELYSILFDKIQISTAPEIEIDFEQKVVLITGGCGSIGSEIVRQISSTKSKKIIVIDNAETPLHRLKIELSREIDNKKIDYILASITNKSAIEQILKFNKIDIIFHAAAYKHVPLLELFPAESIEINILATENLVQLAQKYSVEKFVFISSDKAINPTSIMGACKRAAEIIIQNQSSEEGNTKFITTRFGNVFGSNGSVIELFLEQIENKENLTVTHPDISRYFMTIGEACNLVIIASMIGLGNDIFMFDMGKQIKIADLAKKLIKFKNLENIIEIEYTGLRNGEKLYEELFDENEHLLPTINEKIKIARTREYDKSFVKNKIKELKELMHNNANNLDLVHKLKEIVPEYRPNNL